MENYIPLEYDRSHLDTRKSDQQYGPLLDYFDIALLALNLIAIIVIISYYLLTPRNASEQILLRASDKAVHDIPYFTSNRHSKKGKPKQLKQQKQAKQFNPHTHLSGYNLVELKCLKCTHSTQVYELKTTDTHQ